MAWHPAMAVQGLPGRILSAAAALVLLALAVTFSLLLFAAVATAGLLAWIYLWWKTRGARRQLREQPPGGRVFEGEVVREAEAGSGAPRIGSRPPTTENV